MGREHARLRDHAAHRDCRPIVGCAFKGSHTWTTDLHPTLPELTADMPRQPARSRSGALMDQTMVDRAAIAAFPELKRLVALRASTDWSLSVVFDQNRQFQLVSGTRSHVEGSRDDIGVRSDTEVRVVRHNPLGEAVVMREGSLAEMVDLVLDLPSPLHLLAPRRVLGGAAPGLWVPVRGRARWEWVLA